MTINEFCKITGLTEAQATGKEKIGGYLYLSSVTSIPEGFNPTVGGYLDLRSGSRYIGKEVDIPIRYIWRNKDYIKVDGIFTKIISERGNVMRVQRIAHKEVEYLVTDGEVAGRTVLRLRRLRNHLFTRLPAVILRSMRRGNTTQRLHTLRLSRLTALLRVLVPLALATSARLSWAIRREINIP